MNKQAELDGRRRELYNILPVPAQEADNENLAFLPSNSGKSEKNGRSPRPTKHANVFGLYVTSNMVSDSISWRIGKKFAERGWNKSPP